MNDIRDKARANLAMVNAGRSSEKHAEIVLRGFLATFHPGLSKAEVRELVKASK